MHFLEEFVRIGANGLGVTRSALDLGEIRGLSLLGLCKIRGFLKIEKLYDPTVFGGNFQSLLQVIWEFMKFLLDDFKGQIFFMRF